MNFHHPPGSHNAALAALEREALRYMWLMLGHHRYEEDEFIPSTFKIALPTSINTLQTFVGRDNNIMARTNAHRHMHGAIYLDVERTKMEREGRWVTRNVIVLGLTERYLQLLYDQGTGLGLLDGLDRPDNGGGGGGGVWTGPSRCPNHSEMSAVDGIWTAVVQWVTELCWTRPVPLDEWFDLKERVGPVGIDPSLTTSDKADAMTMLSRAWRCARGDDTAQLLQSNVFFQEREQAVQHICGFLERALYMVGGDPAGRAKHLLSHWLVCDLVEWQVLSIRDRLALAVHVWKGSVPDWVGRLQPWARAQPNGLTSVESRRLVEESIDEWARYTAASLPPLLRA